MYKIRFIVSVILLMITSDLIFAENHAVFVQNKFKEYFKNTAVKVKEAPLPDQKREILNTAFQKMENTLDKIASLPDISQNDKNAISSVKSAVQDKYNELNGLQGYQRIADNQLDKFADYVQQAGEQADQWVTISVTTLLLVAILLILLLR